MPSQTRGGYDTLLIVILIVLLDMIMVLLPHNREESLPHPSSFPPLADLSKKFRRRLREVYTVTLRLLSCQFPLILALPCLSSARLIHDAP